MQLHKIYLLSKNVCSWIYYIIVEVPLKRLSGGERKIFQDEGEKQKLRLQIFTAVVYL